jgi:predicted RNA binding protein YcfA (HicA-like mRNA interferase family)
MTRLPRDISGTELIQALGRLGYEATRTRGSHVRVTTQRDGEHSEAIPLHQSLKVATLHSILRGVAAHHNLTRHQLLDILFG